MVVVDGTTPNSPVLSGTSVTTGALFVGAAGSGALTIKSNAGLANSYGYVGYQSGASGTVTVTGMGTDWVTTSGSAWSPGGALDASLSVGKFGQGALHVSSGALVAGGTLVIGEQAGAVGLVTVNGTGTQFGGIGPQGALLAGYSGAGTLNVSNGGSAAANVVVLGVNSGSTGTVTVDGAGSRLYAATSAWPGSGVITVGAAGTGSVAVSNGGALTAQSGLTLGAASSGTGTVSVSGIGSSFAVGTGAGTAMLVIGWNGTGSLNLAAGAHGTVSGDVILGNAANSSGALNLSGSGTSLIGSGRFYAGFGGSGAVTVSNAAALIADQVIVGTYPADDTLSVQSGGSVTANTSLLVATAANSTGTVSVTGAGSTFTIGSSLGGTLDVGYGGTGKLNVAEGGSLTVNGIASVGRNAGSQGVVTVDGAGSLLTLNNGGYIGQAGSGTLTVSNGGRVASAGNVYVGFNASGSMTVTGAGSQLTVTANDLWISRNGDATVNIANGGVVNAQNTSLGIGTGIAHVTVDGVGSALNMRNIVVGDSNTSAPGSVLTISNGATASDRNGLIGFNPGATGTVVVTGAGSSWTNTAGVVVGRFGNGTLIVSSGATVSSAGAIQIAEQAGSNGFLAIGSQIGSAASAAGTVAAPSILFGAGAGGLVFNHTDANYTFSTPMSGLGHIYQLAGHSNLTGDSSGFTGTALVLGGVLSVNGLLANAQATVSAGVLGGNGVVGTLTAFGGGTVAPGNSIGTLRVAGNATFNSGSFYQVQLDAKGNSDQLAVGGATTLNGGTVQAQVQAGNYTGSNKYTILTSAGGISGGFAGATSDAAFLTPALSYDAADVYLTMTRNVASFASVGATRNQVATGGAVDPLGYGNPIWNAVVTLNAAQARSAFDQLSGDIHASTLGTLVEDSRFVRAAAIDRLREAFSAVGTGGRSAMAYAADPATVKPDARFAVWGRVIGSWGDSSSDGNAAALSHNIGGFFSGIDARVADDWRVGVLTGYTHANLSSASDGSSASIDTYHVGGFAGAQWGAVGFRSGAAYGWSQIAGSRTVAIPGFVDHLAAGHSSGTAQVFGELGYRIDLSTRSALEPFAALAYVNSHSSGFGETGGAAALTGSASTLGVGFSTLGLRGSTGFVLGGVDARWTGMLGWRHAYGDVTPLTAVAFAGSNVFTVAGLPIARDAAAIEAGLDLSLARNVTFGVAYTGQMAKRLHDNGVKADLSWKF
ncbi:autotransporter domain-containing protein [Bradyrhizobium sp. INPA03-11B]|uniref:autotransporter outer membrane beta-barrel domain-containing protein n=1 Tax=Bradyrhizobium sp. INPA03-11B TaxID=418598 RepID=UPI00338F8AA1